MLSKQSDFVALLEMCRTHVSNFFAGFYGKIEKAVLDSREEQLAC
jgi:hypothetical protein